MTIIISDEAVNIALNTWLGGVPAWRNNATERLRTEMRAALTSALPFIPVQVAVKKLEWELVSGDHYAEGAGTHYNIYETKPGLWNSVTVKPVNVRLATNADLEAAKAAAQADYEARILSALEPSAGRAAVLEEALHNLINELSGNPGELIDKMAGAIRDWGSHYDDGPWETLPEDRKAGWRGDAERALAVVKEYLTTRALSSPDHADAGKVEGDGWLPIESAPKDETLFLAYCPADEDFPDGRMMIWKGSIFAFQKNPTPNHLQFPATHWRTLPSAPSQEVAGS